MMFAVAALVLFGVTQPPLPPFRRLDTVLLGGSSLPFMAAGDSLFVVANGHCDAYDLRTLHRKWSQALKKGEPGGSFAVGPGAIFLATGNGFRDETARLNAFDPKSGRLLWSIPRQGASAIAVSVDTLYVGLKPSQLSAVSAKTHKSRWRTTFPKGGQDSMRRGEIETVRVDKGRVLANCDNVTYCLDAASGQVVWKEPDSYVFETELLSTAGVAWVPSNNGSVARDLKSGKEIWRDPQSGYHEWGTVFNGKFVGLSNGEIKARDPRTGKVIWSYGVGPRGSSGGYQFGTVVGDKLFVRGMSKAVVVRSDGKKIWESGADAFPGPAVWSDGKSLVCCDHARLIRYAHGEPPPIPKDPVGRRALAAKMVSEFTKLDANDIKRLKSLGDDAFDSVLAEYLRVCHAYDAARNAKDDSFEVYSTYHDIGDVLERVTTGMRSAELLKALTAAKKDATEKPLILTLLAQHGDPKVVTPFFLKELEGFETPSFERYESTSYVARSYIANSDEPAAVQFMIRLLKNPKADETMRTEAFWNLARTGGDEGLKAVLEQRRHRELLRPLEARLDLSRVGASDRSRSVTNLLNEKKDAAGRDWGLLSSGVLGSRGDLWIAEKVGGAWNHPLFAGISTEGISRWTKPTPPEPTLGGKKASELVAGAWLQVLVGNADLARDSDGDGLTDVEEARLGIDPKKADTDGDGDPDGIDPWPNAPPRELSDAEKVMAAAFEARYHFYDIESPAIFFAEKGMKPFEMVGWRGPVIWQPEGSAFATPLEQCYEQGVAFIRFAGGNEKDNEPWERKLIRWNPARTEAQLTLSTYYGGLAGDGYNVVVRKFGEDWVVVSMTMAWVS